MPGSKPKKRRTLTLEFGNGAFYFPGMKRISILTAGLVFCAIVAGRAQDAAVQERLNQLSGKIEDLTASQDAQRKRIEALATEIQELREQSSKPNAGYASQEDLKRLADAVKEVDRKRIDDAEKIHTELLKLRNALEAPVSPSKKKITAQPVETPKPENAVVEEKGFPYVIQSGDTLSLIVQAYHDKNIKVTVDQILKANPGLKPDKLRVGQKIFIPAPQ